MMPDPRRLTLPFLLAGLVLCGPAAGQESTPASPAEEGAGQRAESAEAIRGIDMQRLQREQAYAEQMLVHIERLRAEAITENRQEAVDRLDYLRLFALPTATRMADARAAIQVIIERRPTRAGPYIAAWYSSLRVGDHELTIGVAETAARSLRGGEWPELRRFLEEQSVWAAFRSFDNDRRKRARLADALLSIGWPNDRQRAPADALRLMMVEDRLAANDVAGASGYARLIISPDTLLRMSVLRRYDALFAGEEDRVRRFRGALEEYDRETAQALAAAPQDHRVVLDRAQFLRGIGREAEALAVLAPFTRDVAATVAASDNGMWLVNEAGYSLMELNRDDEAIALFRRLSDLPIADSPGLVGPAINHGVVLFEAGRYTDALAYARQLEQGAVAQYANDFGKLWVASTIVCSLARLDRAAEAGPWLTRLREGVETNGGALTRALLCLDSLDEAETVVIRRLRAEDPEIVLLGLQDYQLRSARQPQTALDARRAALRQRPAVRAAAERVGHLLSLPIAQTYWGRS
jgi:tetratricopeptide (TPR) repeat protein